ncbi:MAS5 [Hepatospora eriocheir]|uniref:MAS5 n=1 Tax=Hepatospora eriocheir TaxID=1081669 RepID=A0A1X0QH08_9MICR|nr:MAS5 [Hepatospora eriocheir]
MEEINNAYNVLGNEEKKKQYDSGTGEFAENPFGGSGGFDVNDIFNMFGQGGFSSRRSGSSRKSKISDTKTNISISMKEAFLGKKSKFRINVDRLCDSCNGKGSSKVKQCSTCKGHGRLIQQRQVGFMVTETEVECEKCVGSGSIPDGPTCKKCNGVKIIKDKSVVELTIRPGIVNGEKITMRGKGNQAPGRVSGDLVFVITVKDQPGYVRVNNDIIHTVNIDLLTAITGGVISFEHIDGRKLSVNLSPMTDLSSSIKIYYQGFNDSRGGKGDFYIKPNILVNKNLNKEEVSKVIKPLVYNVNEGINVNSQYCSKLPEDHTSSNGSRQQFDSEEDYMGNQQDFIGSMFSGFGRGF